MSGADSITDGVWIDDRLLPGDEATVPYDDHGITVGDGVFETIKLTGGQAFALTRHLVRLRASAEAMGLACPDDEILREAVGAVAASASADGVVRITITAGRGPLASNRTAGEQRLIVATRPAPIRIDPTGVELVRWTRNEHGALAGVKSTSYGENVVALAAAIDAGGSEALFANTAGMLCEGTGSNVFVGFGDDPHDLVTPPLASGCLAGVTRALLLEAGIGREVAIVATSLAEATEAFLVSTAREVQPITSISGVALPRCPGPLTLAARQAWIDNYGGPEDDGLDP